MWYVCAAIAAYTRQPATLNTSDYYLVRLKAGQCKLTKVHKAATLMETLMHLLTMIAFVVDRYRQAKV